MLKDVGSVSLVTAKIPNIRASLQEFRNQWGTSWQNIFYIQSMWRTCDACWWETQKSIGHVFFTAVSPSTKHVWSTTKSPSLTVSCPEPLCHFSFGMTENMSWSSLIILWIKLTKSCRVQNISQGRLGKLGYKNKIWDPESGKVMNQQLKSTGET